MPEPLPDLPAGVWQHYKGPLYLVLGYGHDANADTLTSMHGVGVLGERTVVVYIGLTLDDDAHTGPRLAVRTVDDWFAEVCTRKEHRHYGGEPDDPEVCKAVSRFRYVGPSWEPGPQPAKVHMHIETTGPVLTQAQMDDAFAAGLAKGRRGG